MQFRCEQLCSREQVTIPVNVQYGNVHKWGHLYKYADILGPAHMRKKKYVYPHRMRMRLLLFNDISPYESER